MSVYLIQCGAGPVKIGKADDVEARIRTLQSAHHEVLHVIRAVEGDHLTESRFRERFRRRHIRNEWFHFDPDMLTWEPPPEPPTQGGITPEFTAKTLRELADMVSRKPELAPVLGNLRVGYHSIFDVAWEWGQGEQEESRIMLQHVRVR